MLTRLSRSSLSRGVGAFRRKSTVPHYPTMIWKKDTMKPKNTAFTNEDEAHFCGRKPGTPFDVMEIMYMGCWVIVAGLAVLVYNTEDTTIQTWAREEAKVRNLAKANGVEIEYGKWYNKLVVKETIDEDAEFERAPVEVMYEFQKEEEEE